MKLSHVLFYVGFALLIVTFVTMNAMWGNIIVSYPLTSLEYAQDLMNVGRLALIGGIVLIVLGYWRKK